LYKKFESSGGSERARIGSGGLKKQPLPHPGGGPRNLHDLWLSGFIRFLSTDGATALHKVHTRWTEATNLPRLSFKKIEDLGIPL